MEKIIKNPVHDIAVDWYEGADARKIMLVVHGYGSSKENQQKYAEAMVLATGASVAVIGLSGHGKSQIELRDTRPAQHFLELITVFDWLIRTYPDAEISVSGSSYGGFLAVQLTKYRTFANLILRAPAIYKPNAFYDLWSIRLDNEQAYKHMIMTYRQDAEALARHPLLARAAAFSGNTLVVVHENDEIVPRETTDAYIAAFNADYWVADGFTHIINPTMCNEDQMVAYQSHIANWYNHAR